VEGWVKLYRELLEKPIWQCSSPEHKVILVTLLLMANHEEKEWIWQGKKYKCKPGQFITSLKGIAEKSGTSIQNVRTALKNFEFIYNFLTSKSTNKNRLITIVNWELYQQTDSKVTNKLTSNQQAANKQLTTNKNDKNIYSSSSCSRAGNVFQFYQENIGLISPFQTETLNSYIDDGLKPEVIIEAMKDSLGTDNKWKYLTSILNRCIEQQIYTFEQYEAAKVEHENKKNGTPRSKPQGQIKTWTEIKEEEFERAKRLAFDKLKAEGVKEVDV
jgi:DnaD/phage-associated family protein